ncbi:MAG: UPF0158 family protein [bacterium]|nr:UPF0158 family protein [bacterium]
MQRLTIKRSDFDLWFEVSMYGMVAYLNIETGDVVVVSQDDRDVFDEWVYENVGEFATLPQVIAAIEASREFDTALRTRMLTLAYLDETDRYVELPNQNSSVAYVDMEKFIETVKDKAVRDQLLASINGQGAFRRFKDVVNKHQLWDAWQIFLEKRKYKRMMAWFKSHELDAHFE